MSSSRVFVGSMISGNLAGLLSALAAVACARIEQREPASPIRAISHMLWGGHPARRAKERGLNTLVGFAIHQLSSVFWALFYETLFGRKTDPGDAFASGAAIASAAYLTDYHVVSKRLQPGFDACLSNRSLFCIYAALAAGFGLTGWLRGRAGNPRSQHRPNTQRKSMGEPRLGGV